MTPMSHSISLDVAEPAGDRRRRLVRSLSASTIAAAAAVLTAVVVVVAGLAWADRESGWGAVGLVMITMIGAGVLAFVVGTAAAVLAFRRLVDRADLAGVIIICMIATAAGQLWGYMLTPGVAVVTAPLAWTVPAALLRALRWWVVVAVAAVGVAAMGAGHLVVSL